MTTKATRPAAETMTKNIETRTIQIPQAGGGRRLVTLTVQDARLVADNPPMLDHVEPLKIIDVHPDGTRERVR